jgi:hypothetical protein
MRNFVTNSVFALCLRKTLTELQGRRPPGYILTSSQQSDIKYTNPDVVSIWRMGHLKRFAYIVPQFFYLRILHKHRPITKSQSYAITDRQQTSLFWCQAPL